MTRNTPPWLSVVMCTYQGERFLRETLQSVAVQETADIEIIAIDDGSTDATRSILDAFSERLPICVIASERTGNWIKNTNRGIDEARGNYICFLHQDDVWEPNRLAVLRALTKTHPDCGIFVHPSYYIDATGRKVGRWSLPFPQRDGLVETAAFIERLMVQNLLAIPAPLFRRDLAERVGPMREDLWFLADWEYWGRLIVKTVPYHCAAYLASFRIHDLSQTVTRSHNSDDLRRQYHAVIDSILSQLLDVEENHIQRVKSAAYMNCEVSIMLALMSHGDFSNFGNVCRASLHLGPKGWVRFLRDSRLHQRLFSRLRVLCCSGLLSYQDLGLCGMRSKNYDQ